MTVTVPKTHGGPESTAVADGGGVVADVDPRRLLDDDARPAALAEPCQETDAAPCVALLVEHVARGQRDLGAELCVLIGGELDAGHLELDVLHDDRRALVDGEGDVGDIAAGPHRHRAVHLGPIVAAGAVEGAQALLVGSQGERLEHRTLLPDGEPAPRPGEERLPQRPRSDGGVAVEPDRPETMRLLGIEVVHRDRLGGGEGEDERHQHQRHRHGPHVRVVTGRGGSAKVARVVSGAGLAPAGA